MKNNKKKGFTLVELLVVIAILAILATVSTVGYTAFVGKANQSVVDTEAAQVAKAIGLDLLDDGKIVIVKDDVTYTITLSGDELVIDNNGDIATVLNSHADIVDLDGELEYDANGVLVYTKGDYSAAVDFN